MQRGRRGRKRTRRSDSTADGTETQTPRNPRLFSSPFRVTNLDPFKRTHINRSVREDSNETRRETSEEERESSFAVHVEEGLKDEGVASFRSSSRGHDSGLSGEEKLELVQSDAREKQQAYL